MPKGLPASSQPADYRGETLEGIREGRRAKPGAYVRAKQLLGEQDPE